MSKVDDSKIPQCTICLDQNDTNGKSVVLDCNHIFHDECLNDLVKNCPNCRAKIAIAGKYEFKELDSESISSSRTASPVPLEHEEEEEKQLPSLAGRVYEIFKSIGTTYSKHPPVLVPLTHHMAALFSNRRPRSPSPPTVGGGDP